jgi:hypothetical protein
MSLTSDTGKKEILKFTHPYPGEAGMFFTDTLVDLADGVMAV